MDTVYVRTPDNKLFQLTLTDKSTSINLTFQDIKNWCEKYVPRQSTIIYLGYPRTEPTGIHFAWEPYEILECLLDIRRTLKLQGYSYIDIKS